MAFFTNMKKNKAHRVLAGYPALLGIQHQNLALLASPGRSGSISFLYSFDFGNAFSSALAFSPSGAGGQLL